MASRGARGSSVIWTAKIFDPKGRPRRPLPRSSSPDSGPVSTIRAPRAGFTLLETLVALAISALVLSALYGAMTRAAAARDRATRGAERMAAARALLVRIAEELEGALGAEQPGTPDRFVVAPPPDPGAPWSSLRMASLTGDETRILSYRVEPATPGRGAVLVRRAASRFAPPDAPEPFGVAAVAHVKLFRV
ncbi:MAG TPA: prepilin-type N-terminal cleavage/methylation domain-containing protein, partial [Candidatus Binatus sp.]|nr:prepilin-type N-terminal cleavage/methylation domain-containing protein [Candidatus Binatus sp.]